MRDDDSGCSKADMFIGGKSKCTECPFPHCVFAKDKSPCPTPSRFRRQLRNLVIVQMCEAGKSNRQIAASIGLSPSGVQDIIAEYLKNK